MPKKAIKAAMMSTVVDVSLEELHELIGTDVPFHQKRLSDAKAEATRMRAYLYEVRRRLIEQQTDYPAVAPLMRLTAAQQQCREDKQMRAVLEEMQTLLPGAFDDEQLDEMRTRLRRASASAMEKAVETLLTVAKRSSTGLAYDRVACGAEKLDAAAAAIARQIAKNGDDKDDAWRSRMQALHDEKRAAALEAVDTSVVEAQWHASEEYKNYRRLAELYKSVCDVYALDRLYADARAALNNGAVASQSGERFEQEAQRDENVAQFVERCGFDGQWFLECQRANRAHDATLERNDKRAHIDQSQTPHSLHCAQIGRPNLRVEFNLPLIIPSKKDDKPNVGAGEVDGLVYDACNNNILIWLEMKVSVVCWSNTV